MKWSDTIQRWQRLTVETREQVRWQRIPRQVALSMAFEQKPVDEAWLEKLHRQVAQPATSKPPKGS